ncbi:hypothetical protein SAMN00017477_1944, partial [Peptoniphilus asaccharolyticus DSM 20463]
DNYVINPGETLKVPLGIGLEIPEGDQCSLIFTVK